MKSSASEMGLISELVEVMYLIDTQKAGGIFASETLENLLGNVKCEMWGKHCFEKDLRKRWKKLLEVVLVIFPEALNVICQHLLSTLTHELKRKQ